MKKYYCACNNPTTGEFFEVGEYSEKELDKDIEILMKDGAIDDNTLLKYYEEDI